MQNIEYLDFDKKKNQWKFIEVYPQVRIDKKSALGYATNRQYY